MEPGGAALPLQLSRRMPLARWWWWWWKQTSSCGVHTPVQAVLHCSRFVSGGRHQWKVPVASACGSVSTGAGALLATPVPCCQGCAAPPEELTSYEALCGR